MARLRLRLQNFTLMVYNKGCVSNAVSDLGRMVNIPMLFLTGNVLIGTPFVRRGQVFPYHLGDFVCQVLRITPFKYYCDLLFATMRDELSYDRIPNFTVRHTSLSTELCLSYLANFTLTVISFCAL